MYLLVYHQQGVTFLEQLVKSPNIKGIWC
jgi:hypothetical protein